MPKEHFRIVQTEDGTPTLFSEEFGQSMHTVDGAYREAVVKHLLPSKVLDIDEPVVRVLDVGFGIGYNALAVLEEFLKRSRGRFLEIVSLEKNPKAIEYIHAVFADKEQQRLYEIIQKLPKEKRIVGDNYSMILLAGDARQTVRALEDSHFHAIFHDPYSPAKNPELWTLEFFRELFRTAKDGCVLTTYSSAPQIRAALVEAGFIVGKGPGMGKKREGTIAAKTYGIVPFDASEIAALRALKRATSYRDANLSESREEILLRWKENHSILKNEI
jgi:tRNA U34 5-methylaminomethyl-2-thiouridine-forming methyltransferase MnmC